MTGLFENINALQNEKSLTFLYRTPKVTLKPLNMRAIAESCQKTFSFTDDSARKMAFLTRGYSFAFQVLGYLTWENGGHYTEIVSDYQQYLEDYVYDKIWAKISRTDRFIAYGIASSETGKISQIRQILQLETNQFNPYRKRLIQRGLINGDEYGYVRFVLPLFEQFVLANYEAAAPIK